MPFKAHIKVKYADCLNVLKSHYCERGWLLRIRVIVNLDKEWLISFIQLSQHYAVVLFSLARLMLAVSSSPRPWMHVFALPEKSNMAVTESDPDPKVRKMSITS